MKFTSKVAVVALSVGLMAHGGGIAFGSGSGRGGVDDNPRTKTSIPSSSSMPSSSVPTSSSVHEANHEAHHAAGDCFSSHSPDRVAARTARLNNVVASLTARIASLNASKATASNKAVKKINKRIMKLQRDINKTNARIVKEVQRMRPACAPSTTTPVSAP
ncbi:MAG: hypothetical protein WCJ32_07485 [Actinomycetota bacterium]